VDVSAHAVLRALEPFLEDPDSHIPVHPAAHQRGDEAILTMKNSPRQLIDGFWSLLTGMRITLGQFFKPTVTVQYPHESIKMPTRFRGHIVFVRDPDTGKSLCIACKACEKACPSDCIVVNGIKREGEKRKSVTDFKLDFTKCSLCGSCVEVCPTDALEFSRAYNLASVSKEQFHCIDLVKRLERE
jgi:NADH-quinone oxidoreductase subunit I